MVYGVWNYIKNSGRFPEAETLTLEWVGTIPGKRESRRFEGDYLLRQQDLVEQRQHADAVSFGGWAIDLHPADGVFSEQPPCSQWHSKGVYQIPYRCLYSRNISNLFLAGRLISASHVAFGSTRVMGTCAHNGQAVALAAALCLRHGLKPRDLGAGPRLGELQRQLLSAGQFIPGLALKDPEDLASAATLSASSELKLAELKPNGETLRLTDSVGDAAAARRRAPRRCLKSRWMSQCRPRCGPNCGSAAILITILPTKPSRHSISSSPAGKGQRVALPFDAAIDQPRYGFVCLMANPDISVWLSDQRLTGHPGAHAQGRARGGQVCPAGASRGQRH